MSLSSKDWQAHNLLIHQHDNKRFMQPTKRVLDEPPVIERHDPLVELADLVIYLASIAVLGTFILLGVMCK